MIGKRIRNVVSVITVTCMLAAMSGGMAWAGDNDEISYRVDKKVWKDTFVPPGWDYPLVADALITFTNCDNPALTYTQTTAGTEVPAQVSGQNAVLRNVTPGFYNITIAADSFPTYTHNNVEYTGGGFIGGVTMNDFTNPPTLYHVAADPNLGGAAGGVVHIFEKNSTQQGYNASFDPGDTVTIDFHPYKGKQLKTGSLKYHNGTAYKNRTQEWELTPSGYTDGSTASFTMPAFNVTVTAEFEDKTQPPAGSYTVDFQVQKDDVVNAPAPLTNVVSGSKIQEPLPEPSQDGFSFEGWYKEFDCQNPWDFANDTVVSNTTLWARWLAWFKVIFEDYDGSKITESLVKEGLAASAPAAPDTWDGHHFVGWSQDFSKVRSELWVRAEYEVNQYTVTFKDWDGAILKAQNKVEHGTAATAPVDPARSGYRFSGWDVDFSHVTADINVTAQYVQTHVVTFDAQGGSAVNDQIVNHGAKADLPVPAPTRPGKYIGGWYKENTFVNAWDFANDKVMTNLTLYARWTDQPTGGGSSGGSGSSSSPTVPTTSPGNNLPATTVSGDGKTGTASVTAATSLEQTTGIASAKLDGKTIADLAAKAKEAETSGLKPVVEIKTAATEDAKGIVIEVPGNAFQEISAQTSSDVKVETGLGTILFDTEAARHIGRSAANGDISIGITRLEPSALPQEARGKVGDRPVYNFTVKAGNSEIAGFGTGTAEVSIPYLPKADEDLNAIVVYYIDNQGNLNTVRGEYNLESKTVCFKTGHFSIYAVGYNKVSFKDVGEDAWYSQAVSFLAARSITAGTGGGHYSPQAHLTRGEFMVMVMRAYGIKPDEKPENNFTDAGSTYYTDYLAAAKRLGITEGIGNNMFAPDRELTRQEMFTLLYNCLGVIGELPEGTAGKPLPSFSDSEQIASWARGAVTSLAATGTITGSNGRLNPTDATTRAQMAQMLFTLLK